MPRFYFKLIIPLTLIVFIPLLIVIAFGMTQPQTLGLEGFITDCDKQSQPCWYGVSLESSWNVNTLKIWGDQQPTLQAISNDYYYMSFRMSGCTIGVGYMPRNGSIWGISMSKCGIRIGDVIQFFGEPDNVEFEVGWSTERMVMRYLFDRQTALEIRPYFAETVPSARTFIEGMNFRFCGDPGRDCKGMHWHGLLSGWDYCQLEPDQHRCAAIWATPQPIIAPFPTLPPGY